MALHTVVAQLLEANRKAGRPRLSAGTHDEARKLFSGSRAALGSGPAIGPVTTLNIPTRSGSIPARLFQPLDPATGFIVYLHGGGWVLGALDDFDALTRTLVARSGCALVLVDYRLAPEHPFPAAIEDVEDAIRWAARSRDALFQSELPLIVAGDSAGGNLAAVAAHALHPEIKLALQVLFNPVTDCDDSTESYGMNEAELVLSRDEMQWFFGHYAPRHLWTDPRISPLRTHDMSGAPPAWIATAEYDILRDEAETYAARLSAAGVPVELRRYPGVTHGFARMMNLVDTADQSLHDAAAAISAAVASSGNQSPKKET
jgi:acetyl esterase